MISNIVYLSTTSTGKEDNSLISNERKNEEACAADTRVS